MPATRGGEEEEEPNARMWDAVEEELRALDAADAGVLVVGNVGAASGDIREDPAFRVPALGGAWQARWAAEDALAAEVGERAKDARRARREQKEREKLRQLAVARETPGDTVVQVVQPLRDVPEELRVHGAPPAGSDPADDLDDEACHVCGDGDWSEDNKITFCDGCDVAVHESCYGIGAVPDGDEPWFCRACEHSRAEDGGGGGAAPASAASLPKAQCCLCPAPGGALKRTAEGGWAHLFCSHWIPETFTGNTVRMEPVVGVPSICTERKQLRCQLCPSKRAAATGACIQCSFGNCKFSFHPMCARLKGMHMSIATGSGAQRKEAEEVLFHAYCPKHSPKAAAEAAALGALIPPASVGYPAAQAMLRVLDKELALAGKSGSPQGSAPAVDGSVRMGWKRGRTVLDEDSESEESDSNSDSPGSEDSDYTEAVASPGGSGGGGVGAGGRRGRGRGRGRPAGRGGLRDKGGVLVLHDEEEDEGDDDDDDGVEGEAKAPVKALSSRQFRGSFEEGLHPHVAEALERQEAGVAAHCRLVASMGDRDLLTGYRNRAKALHDAGQVWDGVERPGLAWEGSIHGEEGPWDARNVNSQGAYPDEGGMGPSELGELLDRCPPMPMDEVSAELYALQHQLADVWGANRKALAAVGDRYLRCLPGDLEREEFRRLAEDAKAKLSRFEFKPVDRAGREPKRGGKMPKRRRVQDGTEDGVPASARASASARAHAPTFAERGRPRGAPTPSAPTAYVPVDLIGALAGTGTSEEDELMCAVCGDGTTVEGDELLNCASCDVSVHQKCYGVLRVPQGKWQCQACQDGVRGRPRCELCPVERGAFWRCGGQRFCHPYCVLWTCGKTPEPLPNATAFADHLADIMWSSLDPDMKGKSCGICGLSDGYCRKCECQGCDAVFHPLCARSNGLYLRERAAPRSKAAAPGSASGSPGSCFPAADHMAAVELPPVRSVFCALHSRGARLEDVARYRQSFSDYKSMTAVRLDLEHFRAILDKVNKRERKKVEVVAELASTLQARADRAMAPRHEVAPPQPAAGEALAEGPVLTRRMALSTAATPEATPPPMAKGNLRQFTIFSALRRRGIKMEAVQDSAQPESSPVLKVAPTFVSANRAGGRPPKMRAGIAAAMSPAGGPSPRTAAGRASAKSFHGTTPTNHSHLKRTPMSRRGSNELKGLGVVLSPRSVTRGRYYSFTPERANAATRLGAEKKRAFNGVKRELYAGSKGSPNKASSHR